MIAYTFYMNPSAGWQQTISWILWNGGLSALGAAIALGHPLTVLTAFLGGTIQLIEPDWQRVGLRALSKR